MKKMLTIVIFSLLIFLSGCSGLRERLLAPPDEIEIPEGSLVATCEKDDVVYKHIYQGDGIYQYFIDDELQNEDVISIIQEQAYLHMESVSNYLDDEFGVDGCTIENYIDPIE